MNIYLILVSLVNLYMSVPFEKYSHTSALIRLLKSKKSRCFLLSFLVVGKSIRICHFPNVRSLFFLLLHLLSSIWSIYICLIRLPCVRERTACVLCFNKSNGCLASCVNANNILTKMNRKSRLKLFCIASKRSRAHAHVTKTI